MTSDECARIEELISAQQDGGASPEERAQIERHVAGCARCQATAAAYGQVDRQVRRYLMATPVPELAAPWRNEPVPLPVRRGEGLGHWRATAVGLAAIFALLFTASILAFRPLAPTQSETTGGRPPADSAERGSAPVAAQVAATSTPALAAAPAAAPQPTAAPPQPTAAAASRGASAVAAATRAAASPAGAAGGVPAPASTRAAAPQAGAVSEAPINPAQLLRLKEATELTICRPGAGWCDSQPRTAVEQAAIVAALDRSLPQLAPPTATGSDQLVVMTFRFASGEERVLAYHYPTQRLTLPGDVDVQGSPELASLLAGIVTPR